jgi:galactose-1-phosphate uridylyltransferase
LRRLRDGTVKQVNPFTGTQVWTVPGRADRPFVPTTTEPSAPLDFETAAAACAFCERRYLETPPERERVVRTRAGWRLLPRVPADAVFDTAAEFRVFSNLFEIVSYDYWRDNHGYRPTPAAARHQAAYLASEQGRAHLLAVLAQAGRAVTDADLAAASERFFAGCHDVVVARRHYVDGATHEDQLCSAGDLAPEEHEQYVGLTVRAMKGLYDANPHARMVAAFQNWLRPAGASFDHLHKQLVAVDEYGNDLAAQLERLGEEPDLFERWGPRYAAEQGLVVAHNVHAVATVGIGHPFPAFEVWSRVAGRPWELSARVLRDVSDLLHALHAATGREVPTNEEWHHEPPDRVDDSPLRVILKLRTSTIAGFEGGTRIYLNTIDPWTMRDRAVTRLRELVPTGRLGDVRLAGPGG